ncbi:MAG: dTDP-4-dehydrorhamnose 3,5-epimerase [Planctomycetales bacterium]|nr:dTDP-4-dehydrorhamnose 3,5-epimerase [Planctomycetales bacterium]
MEVASCELSGVLLIRPRVFRDGRGLFYETYERRRYQAAGVDAEFVQDNHSRSLRGTLRGLHYQIEQAQGKLVWVTQGDVFDVVVDLRRSSPTFGQAMSTRLSEENREQLYIPPGFAHGFCVLSETAEFSYKCTDYYSPQHERTLLWNDPALGIDWPIDDPLLSDKDRQGVPLAEAATYA